MKMKSARRKERAAEKLRIPKPALVKELRRPHRPNPERKADSRKAPKQPRRQLKRKKSPQTGKKRSRWGDSRYALVPKAGS